MAKSTNSQVRATTWLKPSQIDNLRSACYDSGAEYLQQRNEAIIQFAADTGLRVGELVQVDVEHLRDGNARLFIPEHIQKDYPNENSPDPARMQLADETKRLLSAYLANRWKDPPALFPSRVDERITTEGVRNLVKKTAATANVRPFRIDGTRADPSDVTPHTLRHSVAYRMLTVEEGNTLYDVRNRLRHASIQTTEQVYDHFDEI